jgi:alkaline phosphatase
MRSRFRSFLLHALITLAMSAVVLFVFSRFGGEEFEIGNLVVRAQNGRSYPLQAPRQPVRATSTSGRTVGGSGTPVARNLVIVIGDGMGIGHVSAASDLLSFPGATLAMTDTTNVALVRTWTTDDLAPDSAATGTALATGFKTRRKAVGVLEDGTVVRNLFEAARERGLATGVITTSGLVDATPACFTTHVDSRDDYHLIFVQMVASGTDLFVGGDWTRFRKAKNHREYRDLLERADELGQANGYHVIRDPNSIDTAELPLLALFPPRRSGGNSHGPALAVSSRRAIELLRQSPRGFVLLVESEITDEFGHHNDIAGVMEGMRELNDAVATILAITETPGDTLVVVTADHDTGTLAIVDGDYEDGRAVAHWATGEHSSQWVPLFAFGPGAELFSGVLDNTEVALRMARALGLDAFPYVTDISKN